MSVESMYQEIILDHYREKLNAGLRDPYQVEVHHVNPSCGDEITLRVELDGDRVADVSYDAQGCSISQASTSVMSELLIERDVADSLQLHDEFLAMMQSQGRAEPDEDRLEDGIAFVGVSQFPARVKCAMLGWSAVRDAILRAQAGERGSQAGTETVSTEPAGTGPASTEPTSTEPTTGAASAAPQGTDDSKEH